MALIRVDFDDTRVYIGNRPHGTVTLYGPGGSHGTSWTVSALVDTGADYMHLPEAAALGVGLSLGGAVSHSVSTAGGIITVQQMHVQIEIEGVPLKIPVNFGKNVPALIGMQALFQLLDVSGFDTKNWLLTHLTQFSLKIG